KASEPEWCRAISDDGRPTRHGVARIELVDSSIDFEFDFRVRMELRTRRNADLDERQLASQGRTPREHRVQCGQPLRDPLGVVETIDPDADERRPEIEE